MGDKLCCSCGGNHPLDNRIPASGLADGPQWLIDAWGGPSTLAGERVSTDGSLSIVDVFAAVDIIAETSLAAAAEGVP